MGYDKQGLNVTRSSLLDYSPPHLSPTVGLSSRIPHHCCRSSRSPFKRLIRKSQEYFDFLRFSRGCRRQGVEVFEETGPRKTGGAKVPFDNFDPENYLGDVGLGNAATRFAGPVPGVQGVENALRGNFDLRLERRHSTLPGSFPSLHASGHCVGDPILLEVVTDKIGWDCDGLKIEEPKPPAAPLQPLIAVWMRENEVGINGDRAPLSPYPG